ncbi:MAG: nuclear transport factor 2 family protein [Rhodothermales bacterium]
MDILEAGPVTAMVDPVSVFYRMTSAFNAHDVDGMLAYVDDDIQWFSISGDHMDVEARGKAAFRAAMESYFEAIPSARSEIESAVVSGSYVSVRERAYWGEDQSQVALGVFEVRDGLITRVWYYPASK